MARRVWSPIAAVLAACLVAGTPTIAQAPRSLPEVIRVRLPSERALEAFPPGTPVRRLPAPEFENLLDRADRSARDRDDGRPPSLIRARHEVRWDQGTLTGRSELSIDGTTPGPAYVPLEPWTAALIAHESGPEPRTRSGGRLALRVEGPGPQVARLRWAARSRSESEGRVFDLALPDVPLSRLVLNLPVGLRPEGLTGVVQGPGTSPESDRRLWQIDGVRGELTLRLRPIDAEANRTGERSPWIRERTRVEVMEASASWSSEWTVETGPASPRRLLVELDDGLKAVAVTGADVSGFETEPASEPGAPSRLTILLDPTVRDSTRLRIDALAAVPGEGVWKVPAARPVDAHWAGGLTEIGIGSSRSLANSRPLAGRRVPVPAESTGSSVREGRLLRFEAARPESVAELTFSRPRLDATVEVRGLLRLGPPTSRFEATFTWRPGREPSLELPIDLPRGWMPDRVQIPSLDEPTVWRLEWLPEGGSRVIVTPPPYLDPVGAITVRLSAASTDPTPGRVEAPRPRPATGRIADEVWAIASEPGVEIRPTRSRGVAWLDPSVAGRFEDEAAGPTSTEPSRPALAWRWILPDALAEFSRARPKTPPVGDCRVVATLADGRLRLDWRLALRYEPDSPPGLRFHTWGPIVEPPRWRVLDPSIGIELTARRLDPGDDPGPDALPGSTAWMLDLPESLRARTLLLQAGFDLPWNEPGDVPIFALPSQGHARGTLLVSAEPGVRLSAEAEGLAGIAVPPTGIQGEESVELTPSTRPELAFQYGPSGGRLTLRTERLGTVSSSGLIVEARYRTPLTTSGDGPRWAVLNIRPGPDRKLVVRLPEGEVLEEARIDGRAATPTVMDHGLEFPLPAVTCCELTLVYRREAPRKSPEDDETWPAYSYPSLATTWEVAGPADWRIESTPETFELAGPGPSGFGPLEFPRLGRRAVQAEVDGQPLADLLESRLREAGPIGPTLGDWLARIDAGERPWVVDRLALAGASLGPGTPIADPGLPRDRPGQVFDSLGLRVIGLGRVILLTTAEAIDGPRAEPTAWSERAIEAAASGADPSDRLQSIARWRGEATPASGSSASLFTPGAGQSIQRFSRSGTPADAGRALGASSRTRLASGGALALFVLAIGIAAGRIGPTIRAIGLGLLLAFGLTAAVFGGPRISMLGSGSLCGGLGVAAFWAGCAAKRRGRGGPPARSATRGGSSLLGGSASMLAVLAASLGPTLLALGQTDPAASKPPEPILAIFPFDDPDEIDGPPASVLVRLADLERLEALTVAPADPVEGEADILRARHRLKRRDDGRWGLTSEYDLSRPMDRSGRLIFPVEGASEIRASLGGVDLPVRVLAGSREGEVRLPAGTGSNLRLELSFGDDRGTPPMLAIAASAMATLATSVEALGEEAMFASARGPISRQGSDYLVVLGPADSIVIDRPDATNGNGLPERIEGRLVWDLEPAGDRLRARLTIRDPDGTSRLRLELEPGLLVRWASFPGWDEAQRSGTPERPIWEARPSTPWRDGDVVDLEFWRPRPDSPPGPFELRPGPRLTPLGVESFDGTTLVRIGDSSDAALIRGNLRPARPADRMTDDEDDPLRHARVLGVSSWSRTAEVVTRLAPRVARPRIAATLQLEVGVGRLDLSAEAVLTDESGDVDRLVVRLPADLRVLQVEADGLTDWIQNPSAELRLRFDGPVRPTRKVRIRAWLPVDAASEAIGEEPDPRRSVPLPWLEWPGAELTEGRLTVVAPPTLPFALEERTRLGVVRAPAADETGAFRAAYEATGSSPTGTLRWVAEPPRADVAISSHLAVLDGRADWTALIAYTVVGGPAREMRFRIPSDWTDRLDLSTTDGPTDWRVERSGGRALLIVRNGPALWGTSRLVLRSSRSIGPGTLDFPDLVPLGNGQVETYLAWTDRARRGVIAENPSGVQRVDPARFDRPGLPIPWTEPANVYRVQESGWSLRFRLPPTRSPGTDGSGSRRVALAEMELTLTPEGQALGVARFHLSSGNSRWLGINLPMGLEPIHLEVGGRSVRPGIASDGRLVVPLEGEAGTVVAFTWSEARPDERFGLPSPVEPGVPTVVNVQAAEGLDATPRRWAFPPIRPEVALVERHEALTRLLAEGFSRADRETAEGRSRIVAALADSLLDSRAAMRRIDLGDSGVATLPDSVAQGLRNRVRTADRELQGRLRTEGLETLGLQARARVEVDTVETDPPAGSSRAATAPELRLRRLGRPLVFLGRSSADGTLPPIEWARERPRSSKAWPAVVLTLGAPLLAVPAALFATRNGRRRPLRSALLAIAGLGVAWWAGVAAVVVAIAPVLFLLGRYGPTQRTTLAPRAELAT